MKKGIAVRGFISSWLSSLIASGLCAGLMLVFFIAGFAQGDRHNDYRADQALRSNARVNPSTLAMELSIPLAGLPGRAGNSVPVGISYSSKVWELKTLTAPTDPQIAVRVLPRFSTQSAAGWTSTLNLPRIDYDQYDREMYYVPANGDPQAYILAESPDNVALFYVKRVRVVMPGGSSVEFRKDDAVYERGASPSPTAADKTGTFLSVDGSRMRLEMGTTTTILFLPDGGRYFFAGAAATPTTFIDRHGNKTTLTETQTTDTLGRLISNPVPLPLSGQILQTAQTVGTDTYYYPGIGSVTRAYNLIWAELTNVLDSNQSLQPLGAHDCGQPPTAVPNALFASVGFLACGGHANSNPVVLSQIELPDGSSYRFKYNSYGEITRIDYPTGGYERFEYQQVKPLGTESSFYDKANRGVKFRWVSEGGTGATESMSKYEVDIATPGKYLVKITAPDLSYTEQFLLDESNDGHVYGFTNTFNGRANDERSYSTTGVLMSRKLTKWTETGSLTINGVPGYAGVTRDLRPEMEVSIIFEPGATQALATMSETVYDTHSDPEYFAQLNPKQSKAHNYIVLDLTTAQTAPIATISALFNPLNLASTSETDYLYDANYKARNINGLAIETRVKDASGNIKAKSQIAYDEVVSYPLLTDVSSVRWEDPLSNYRGLVTTSRSWSDIPNNLFVETHAQYDRLGNPRKSWDGKGNLSQIEYSSTYDHAYPTKTISPIPGGNGSTTAFETTVVYDFNTGLPTSSIDANGLETRMEYADPLLRPTKVSNYHNNQPVGAVTETSYGAGTSAATRWVKVRSQIDAEKWKEGYSWFDGLGRGIKSQSVDSSGDVFSETLFDNVGRPWKTSNPYRGSENPLWTENIYDTAGRVWKIKTPDGAEVETAYGVATTGNQIGTVVTVNDQAEKQRRSITNALGQLTRVDEPNDAGTLGTIDAPVQPTFYTYDPLSNLSTVSQGIQTRSFSYDSLSRLKNATNPESGLIQYLYDNNGNLTQKTDARLVVTNYVYDALNRVINRNYTAPGGLPNYQATPNVAYAYDNVANAKGKLTKVTNGTGTNTSTTDYVTFDILGRVTRSKQTTVDIIYGTDAAPMTYTYNLSGALIEQTYPSGRVVKNTLDADGDLAQVQSKKNSSDFFRPYASSFVYNAAGAVSSLRLGNGKFENIQFNSRLQPIQIGLGSSASTQNLLKLNYDYGTTDNNGNVKSQIITAPTVGASPGFVATQTYTYDSLNRINDAKEMVGSTETWKQTFLYDRYGNRNFDTTLNRTTTLPAGCAVAVCNPTVDPATNKLVGYVFDNAGNTKTDANGQTFVYDSENKQVQVNNSNGIVGQYFYDGDGKRIKKVVPSTGETTVFVYDAAGKSIAEYSTVVASTNDAKISYLSSDHLGSPRITTDATGQVISRRDFMPFGDEIARANYGSDSVRQKFTGYERDNETGLDFAHARIYNFQHGRFSSPDDFVNDTFVSDPQTWNLYVYVRNNPLRYSDPDGEERIKLGDSEEKVKKDLEEARQKKKEIEKDKSLSKDERKKQLADQKAKINTFETKLEGTKVVNSILKALDKVGERNGLQLSDFELTTDGKNDFPGLSEENRKRLLGADAFTNVSGEGKTIFIRTETPDGFYRQSLTNSDYIYYGASGLAHEQDHRDYPGRVHSKAFERQKVVLKKFQNYYRNRALYDFNLQFVEEGVNGKYN